MSNIQKGSTRQKLADNFLLDRPEIVTEQVSTDGTRKWLFRFRDPKNPLLPPVEVETVYIPEEDRGTLCVSSQVGCTLTCSFCHTGTQKLVRNLTAGEILGQMLMARERLGDFPAAPARPAASCPPRAVRAAREGDSRAITNVVMMGMGEPLYNYDNVKQALLIASDEDGHLAFEAPHHALDLRRRALHRADRPRDRRHARHLAPCRARRPARHAGADQQEVSAEGTDRRLPRLSGPRNARRITFEYVMLRDINDSDADARELVRLLAGIPAKINLIPFNPWPGTNYDCSTSSSGSSSSPISSTAPATPRRSAPRAAATSSPPAASSRARASG
jgi:23S rRNA (adenine2503-C2)-methyltransferase